ncbi:MAG: ABC transporter substrate-binding protein [Pseudomonadota bacterium]
MFKTSLLLILSIMAAPLLATEEKSQETAQSTLESKETATPKNSSSTTPQQETVEIPGSGSPDEIVKLLSEEMIKRIQTLDRETRTVNSLYTIIEQVLMPHIAHTTVARRVLSKHWKKATKEQQEKFTQEFSTFMILFYAKAFNEYTNETIEYKPMKKYKEGDKRAMVETVIDRKSDPSINVKYSMKKYKSGWKVVDIIVEGVSLVISKNKEYNPLVAAESWDTLVAKLAFKNKQALQ